MSDKFQTKISDSRTWVFCLKHFTKQNCGHKEAQEECEKEKSERQYVIAATFDCWLALRLIDGKKYSWQKFVDMKMAMPVVNAFIEFDHEFKPVNMVLAYFDGSIEWCPWDKVYNFYFLEIEAGKKRDLSKTLPQVLKQISRPAYVNVVIDEFESIEEAFMLQTTIFLHKKGQYIYAINFKGEMKVFKVIEAEMKIKLIEKFQFGDKVVQSQLLQGYSPQHSDPDAFIIAICFESLQIPIVLQLSFKTTFDELRLKIKKIIQKLSIQALSTFNSIKHITYDVSTESLITCSQQNEIRIFSLDRMDFLQKDIIIIPQIQKIFFMPKKDTVQVVNGLSVQENRLLILCTQSFYLYDIREGTILNEGQKLSYTLDMGNLVSPSSNKNKPVLLLKKKFNVLDPKERSSTTLHLFMGK